MKKENNANHFLIPYIFILLLFLTIAIISFMMILAGKNIYKNINEDREINYCLRVSLSYVANKIRQGDKNEGIEIKNINGNNALIIKETYNDINYETWIYHYDGCLYEIFIDEGSEFEMIDGNEIIKVEGFEIVKVKDNLFKFTVKSKNIIEELSIAINSCQ
ncbi:MAG: DUF4860 domain-containing protein [Tissierellia bacterium]|nr:DUF4860 domain-containing protein [Tissierellia bacterium]MDD4780364.1 DUF4860 domain-containing protein [Tissierellia bacterium]